MQYIKQTPREDGSILFDWYNGAEMGYVYKEVDGFYVFMPILSNGFWSQHALSEIASALKELNKEWDDKTDQYYKDQSFINTSNNEGNEF